MKDILKKEYKNAYYICLVLLAISLPLSKFMMSVFQFVLVIIWLWDGFSLASARSSQQHIFRYFLLCARQNSIHKIKVFFKNKLALIAASLFLLYLFGLLYNPNWTEAGLELKGKLPILGLALILGSMPVLSHKQYRDLIFWFTFAIFVAVILGYIAFFQRDFSDPRDLVLFVSPVRFSLMSCFAIFSVAFYIIKDESLAPKLKAFLILQSLTILSFLFLIESIIGILILIVLVFIIGSIFIYSLQKTSLKFILTLLVLAGPIILFLTIKSSFEEFYKVDSILFEDLDTHTYQGEQYKHDTINFGIEDGKYIGLYLAENELKDAWEERSNIYYNSTDLKAQPIRKTLIRYLNSKDLRKDSKGVNQLTDLDISHIEAGIANINYVHNPGIKTRLSRILFGLEVYKRTNNPNGNSLMQRFEYWVNTWNIFAHNPLIGVGYTNLPEAFAKQYSLNQTKLDKNNQMETHNQYLLVLAGFGLIGFIWFMLSIFSPILISHRFLDYHYLIFMIIIALSMLSEDTLQTQVGVTFFAFFNSVLLFGKEVKHTDS